MSVLIEWARTADAAQEPITVEQAKAHCQVFHADDDAWFATTIQTARHLVEERTSRGLYTQTWQAVLSDWADEVSLPRAAPLQSITTLAYYDTSGTLTTLASSYYGTRDTSEPGVVYRKPDQVWPALQADRRGRVVVTYVVGWASIETIPAWATQAMLVLIEHFYANRGSASGAATGLPPSVAALLAAHQVWVKPTLCATA